MKKILVAILITTIIFTLAACGKAPPKDGETPTESPSSIGTAPTDLYAVPELAYVNSITVPYKEVLSPIINGDLLYMAVAKADRPETDTNRLISYNIKTGEEKILFTSNQELANIQCIQSDGEWLVWADIALYGSATEVYAMNLESGKITQVTQFKSDEASFIYPVYMDEIIYWIQEEGVTGEDENALVYGSIYAYDCESGKSQKIAKVNNIYTNNLRVGADDGKIVWFDRSGENGAYYIYDADTQQTVTLPSRQKDAMGVKYIDGYIFALETDSYKQKTPKKLVCIDTNTKAYKDWSYWDFQTFHMTENYLLGSLGATTVILKRDKNNLIQLEDLTHAGSSSASVSPGDVIISVEENEGRRETPFVGLKNEVKLIIYRLSERT